jgi:hypothetical protein
VGFIVSVLPPTPDPVLELARDLIECSVGRRDGCLEVVLLGRGVADEELASGKA